MTDSRLPRGAILVVFALMAAVTCACDRTSDATGTDQRQLTGTEIQSLFSGKTVHGRHQLWNYDFRSYYEKSGTFRSHQLSPGSEQRVMRSARWWVTDDQICIHWQDEDPPGDLCRHIFVDHQGNYTKVLKLKNGRHKLIVRFKSFAEGNPEGL